MCRRLLCLLCAAVLVLGMVGGAAADGARDRPPAGVLLSGGVSGRRPSPLVSAMFLVLAGMGISFLFDKRDHE